MSEEVHRIQPTPRTIQTIDLSRRRALAAGVMRPDPGKNRLYYRFNKLVLRYVFKIYFRGRIVGHENIPASGPVLILANHQSFLDPPFIGSMLGREVHYLARGTLFDSPLFGALLTSYNVHKIRREGIDREAMKLCGKILRSGWPLLLFPEGTRSPDGKIGEVKGGFAMILEQAPGVPILPAIISGSGKAYGRGKPFPLPTKVSVTMGKPITLAPRASSQSRRDYYDDCAEKLKNAWKELGGEFDA